ncbi:MAG TPA: Mur ligase family protein [Polyangiaceae bacterium]|nr:Mur ligase family protein [Polyangiaceae bacterium]
MHIHFVGVAGSGMGALAGLLRALGHDVSGSDVRFDPPVGPELEGWGVRCMIGFDPAHLEPRPDCVVVGNVCGPDNVEARAAIDGGLRVTTMPHALVDHVLAPAGCSPLVVAGTHGKTTTSAMVAWLLDAAGKRPGFFIGGLPKNFTASFRAPPAPEPAPHRLHVSPEHDEARAAFVQAEARFSSVPFVVEGDEYDTAFFEKTPKFWHYRAEVAIVTSIEHDHIDIYPTDASYLEAFHEFLRRMPASGLVVAAGNERHVVETTRASAPCRVSYYALEGDDTFGVQPEWLGAPGTIVDGMQEFDLYIGGVACGRMRTSSPGVHNVRNAVAAIAAAAEGYGCPVRELVRAISTFQGVRRRQDLVGEVAGVRVYDDYAHHPTAVSETLRALRAKHPSGKLFAVFEPRSATACRALHQTAYGEAFRVADNVIIAPLGRANIPVEERLDVSRLVQAIAASGPRAAAPPDVDAIVRSLAAEARDGDTIALLSNGAFGGIHRKLLDALGRRS